MVSKVVITEFMDESAVAGLRGDYDVTYEPDLADRATELELLAADASALIVRNRTQVRGAVLDRAARLRVIGRLGVGLDNIDLEVCAQRGIEVCPATGANDDAVAEYVVSAALSLLRGAYAVNTSMLAGEWPREHCMGAELAGKRLGLIGMGGIARATLRRAIPLGMQISGCDPLVAAADAVWSQAGRMTLEALLETSDVVSLHVPLTKDTKHLIDAAALERMKPGAVLINAARGGVVDDSALATALRVGKLAGAALDVFENEPLDSESAQKFQGLPNLILTPHIAGVTRESNERVSRVTADNVRRVLAGSGKD